MPNPVPGSPYVVVSGDNLSRIAKRAYGDASKWRIIWKANQTVLKSDDPNAIFPGEVINIPGDPVVSEALAELGLGATDLQGKAKDEFSLIIDGIEIKAESSNVKRTIDTASDGWTAVSYWDPDLEDLYNSAIPYRYRKATPYLGGKQITSGPLTVTDIKGNIDGDRVQLEGYSKTIDAVDSTLKPPYEINNVTLKERVKDLVEPLGIGIDFQTDPPEKFNRVTADPTETIFSHLASLAMQRRVLISSSRTGDLVVWNAKDTKPVGSITDFAPPGRGIEARFDGRKRFNVYKAIAQGPKNNKITAVAKDPGVPKSRFQTFSVNESTQGDIQRVADWRRSKQLADALTIQYPVDSWYAPNGELWDVNTMVTVTSRKIFVPLGFDFLIRSVEYLNSKDGTPAILGLIPRQVYTGEDLIEPWAESRLF
jgi:prophage tail gpP-like protein